MSSNDLTLNTSTQAASTGGPVEPTFAKLSSKTPHFEDHPLAAILPLGEEKELRELAHDIEINGQHEPAVVHEDKILDGRRRARACVMLGIPLKTVLFKGGLPAAFVMSKNVHRRHLTPSQRAAIAVEMLPHLEAETKQRQKHHGGTAPGRTKV